MEYDYFRMAANQQLPPSSQVMSMQQSQGMAQPNLQQAQDPKQDIVSQTKLLVTKLKNTLSVSELYSYFLFILCCPETPF